MRRPATPAWRSYPTPPPLVKLDCRRFPTPSGSGFLRPRKRRWTLSASSTPRAVEALADPLSITNSDLLRPRCDHGAVGQDYAC
jgi:hypothetical protein